MCVLFSVAWRTICQWQSCCCLVGVWTSMRRTMTSGHLCITPAIRTMQTSLHSFSRFVPHRVFSLICTRKTTIRHFEYPIERMGLCGPLSSTRQLIPAQFTGDHKFSPHGLEIIKWWTKNECQKARRAALLVDEELHQNALHYITFVFSEQRRHLIDGCWWELCIRSCTSWLYVTAPHAEIPWSKR